MTNKLSVSLLAFLLALPFSVISFAEEASPLYKEASTGNKEAIPSDASVDALIADLAKRVLVTGTFTQQKHIQGLSKAIHSSGQFVYWRNQGIYLETQAPFFNGVTIAKQGSVQWLAPGEINHQVPPENTVRKEINALLLSILTADLAAIEARFSLDWSLSTTDWKVIMTPKNRIVAKALDRVELGGVRGDASSLDYVSVAQADGGQTSLAFVNGQTVLDDQSVAEVKREEATEFCDYFLIERAQCQSLVAQHFRS